MADKIVVADPTKPGLSKVTGPTMVNNLVPLAGLDGTGAVLNSVIAFNGATWSPAAAPPSADTASNLGAGANVFKSKVGADFQFRSIIGTGANTVTQNANDITILGAVITASNLGAGNGVFSAKVGNDLQFKSLLAGANITLTPTGNDITIAATGGSGTFTESFTSTAQTITAAGLLTLAHGLTGTPTLFQARLVNVTGEAGYIAGDETLINISAQEVGAGRGISVRADATNVFVRYSDGASTFIIANKTTGAFTALTNANWTFKIKAWK